MILRRDIKRDPDRFPPLSAGRQVLQTSLEVSRRQLLQPQHRPGGPHFRLFQPAIRVCPHPVTHFPGIGPGGVLRGLQSRDLSVLIDGQRVYGACPNHMDPAAFHVDFAEVDRVEVGKGPFDLKNQGGLGGTVNVVTRKPEPGWHATPGLAAGSFGFVNPSLTVGRGGKLLSALAGYSYRRGGPLVDGSGRRFTELANYLPDARDDDAFSIGTAWGRHLGARAGPPARRLVHPPGRRRRALPVPADGRDPGRHEPREPALRGDRPRHAAGERPRPGLLHAGRPLDDRRAAQLVARQAEAVLDGHAGRDAHGGRQGRGRASGA